MVLYLGKVFLSSLSKSSGVSVVILKFSQKDLFEKLSLRLGPKIASFAIILYKNIKKLKLNEAFFY